MKKSRFHDLLSDEAAQATTEYILMLAVAVTLGLMIIKKLIQPQLANAAVVIQKRLEQAFAKGLHDPNFVNSLLR